VDVITRIIEDKRFTTLCQSLTKNHKDLWHDVIIKLIENRTKIEKADSEGYLDNYVFKIIYLEFCHDIRDKSKSKLTFIADNQGLWSDYKTTLEEDNTRYKVRKAVSELHKIKTPEAELLWRACNSNIHTVSKEERTSFYQIKKKIEPVIKQLKRKLNE
jgi:hypothetical protein